MSPYSRQRPEIVDTIAGDLHFYDLVDEGGRRVYAWRYEGGIVEVCVIWMDENLEKGDNPACYSYEWDTPIRVMRSPMTFSGVEDVPCRVFRGGRSEGHVWVNKGFLWRRNPATGADQLLWLDADPAPT